MSDESSGPEGYEPLTPWQRMRVFRGVAKRLRAQGQTAEADALERFARQNGQDTLV